MTAPSATAPVVSFGAKLAERAAADPAGEALILARKDGSETAMSWGELDAGANRWARALAAKSLGEGAIAALAVPNSIELVLAALACWKLGAVPIPMRWDLPQWEHERLLEVISPTVLISESNVAEFAQSAAQYSAAPLPDAVSPAVNGICSSGSTGLPKIILTDVPAAWTIRHGDPFISHWTEVGSPQTILVPAPMYHTNGFNTLIYLLGGDRLVVMEKFDAARVLDLIEQRRVTTFTATPTMLSRIADLPDVGDRDLSSVEWIMQGAAVMPRSLLLRWFELLGPQRIVMAYGMTENLGLAALRGDEWLEHPGSVGRGFRDTEIGRAHV